MWRVFGIEIERCAGGGEKLRILASIEAPEVISKNLSHLERTALEPFQVERPLGARPRNSASDRRCGRAAWPPDVPVNVCGGRGSIRT